MRSTSGDVRFTARQRAVEPPCRCGSGVGIYNLMKKAQVDFPHTTEGFIFMDLVMCHTDETLEQWQKYLDEIESPKIKLYDKKLAEKNRQNREEREKSKKRKVHKFHKIN